VAIGHNLTVFFYVSGAAFGSFGGIDRLAASVTAAFGAGLMRQSVGAAVRAFGQGRGFKRKM